MCMGSTQQQIMADILVTYLSKAGYEQDKTFKSQYSVLTGNTRIS